MKRILAAIGFCVVIGCASTSTPPSRQPGDMATSSYVRNENRSRVIVFVHGLNGDGKRTWTAPNGAYWPDLIRDDRAFADADIYIADYPTDFTKKRNLEIEEAADLLSQYFKKDHIFQNHAQVIFIAHSMGGLVVRSLLLRDRPAPSKVPLLYFFGTPTEGSPLATTVSPIIHNPAVQQMKAVTDDDNGPLWPMEGEWRKSPYSDRHQTISYCAYEKLSSNGIQVVDRTSASALCDQSTPIMADHDGIVQPQSREDAPYVLFLNAYRDAFEPRQEASASVRTPRAISTNVALASRERHAEAAASSIDGSTVVWTQSWNGDHSSIWSISGHGEAHEIYRSTSPINDVGVGTAGDVYFSSMAPQFSFWHLTANGVATLAFNDEITSFALSSDARRVAYLHSAGSETEVVVRNVDGSGETHMLTVPSLSFIRDLSFSPDDTSLLFVDNRGIVSFDIAKKVQRVIRPHELWGPTVSWSGDGTYLIATHGSGALERLTPNGEVDGVGDLEHTYYRRLAPTNRPNTFFGLRQHNLSDVYIKKAGDQYPVQLTMDGASGDGGGMEWTPFGSILYSCGATICEWPIGALNPRKLAGGAYPHLTPNRRSIIYGISNGPGKNDLIVMDVATHTTRTLTNADAMPGPIGISPDSRFVVYNSQGTASEQAGTYLIAIDGKDRRFLFPEYSKAFAFANDGRSIYFIHSSPFGELYRFDLTTNQKATTGLTAVEMFMPSHDGKKLACVPVGSSLNPPLVVVDTITGRETGRIPMVRSTGIADVAWSADDKTLFYVAFENTVSNIFSVAAGGGESHRVTDFTEGYVYRIVASPTSDEIAFVRGLNVIQPAFLTLD